MLVYSKIRQLLVHISSGASVIIREMADIGGPLQLELTRINQPLYGYSIATLNVSLYGQRRNTMVHYISLIQIILWTIQSRHDICSRG